MSAGQTICASCANCFNSQPTGPDGADPGSSAVRHEAPAVRAPSRHRCGPSPRQERVRLPRDNARHRPGAAPATGAGWPGIPRSGCRAGARPSDQSCVAIRDECDASIRQSPSRRTQARAKRKRPLHGCPLRVSACTLVPRSRLQPQQQDRSFKQRSQVIHGKLLQALATSRPMVAMHREAREENRLCGGYRGDAIGLRSNAMTRQVGTARPRDRSRACHV